MSSNEKNERERCFCTHGQDEYPSFLSRNIVPHVLKYNIVYFFGGEEYEKIVNYFVCFGFS